MSVRTVNTHEAKTKLSELLRDVESGVDVIVARNGRPVAKIIPWPPARPPRTPGAWAGLVDYGDEDIVTSDDDVLAMFDESIDDGSP